MKLSGLFRNTSAKSNTQPSSMEPNAAWIWTSASTRRACWAASFRNVAKALESWDGFCFHYCADDRRGYRFGGEGTHGGETCRKRGGSRGKREQRIAIGRRVSGVDGAG